MTFDVEFIVPYRELKDVVIQAFQDFDGRSEINLHVVYLNYEEVKKHEFIGDVIVARGLSASFIDNLELETPLVEIPITGYDVIQAVHTGMKECAPEHIAFIGSPDVVYQAEVLEEFLGIKVSSYPIQHGSRYPEVIETARRAGADLFIGGGSVHDLATAAGYRSVRIASGKKGVRQALNEAWRAARIRHQERTRSERLRTLVDNVHQGIIAVDQLGRVTVINDDAKQLMRIRCDKCVGRYAAEIVPEIDFVTLSRLKEPSFGDLARIHGKNLTTNRIPIKVGNEIAGHLIIFQEVEHIQEIETRIRQEVHRKGLVTRYSFDDMIGRHRSLKDAVSLAYEYAGVNADILIVGETGTGKELFAQSIHAESARRNGPFVAINCAALPESLLESELFGYVEGAFTGAAKGGKAGLFELAHRGTIFLDEISELPKFLQGRLLRVIEEREIMRLGHDEVMPVDIRIISATNKDLRAQVVQGLFREDLLYRLDVLRLNIPVVKDRADDIRLLIEAFLTRDADGRVWTFDSQCWSFLLSRNWEGNVRQIRNFCRRLSVISKGPTVTPEDAKRAYGSVFFNAEHVGSGNGHRDPWMEVRDKEREMIIDTLRAVGGNRAKAAGMLGIDRSTLWRRMKRLGLD